MRSEAHPIRPQWLAMVLACLLALGPFLHSHFGISHTTGFHLDGIPDVETPFDHAERSIHADPDESPAVGIATSMPRVDDEVLGLMGLFLLVVVLQVVAPHPASGLWLRLNPTPWRAIYCDGWPPPSLAPPAHQPRTPS